MDWRHFDGRTIEVKKVNALLNLIFEILRIRTYLHGLLISCLLG